MSQVVEITIDLNNPNCKPLIEAFEITKVGERNIYCKGNTAWDPGRRFFKPNMGTVKYRGFLKYTYQYQTDETDFGRIMESGETAEAIRNIVKYLESDLKCYQGRLNGHLEYCRRNLKPQETAGVLGKGRDESGQGIANII